MLTAVRNCAHIHCGVSEKKRADGLTQRNIKYSFSALCAKNNNKQCISVRCTKYTFITPKMHD